MSAKKNVHVPLRYHKIKTKKLRKKEENSKTKGLKLRKRIVVCRNYTVKFFTFIYHYCCFEHKQVILAFIFVFIVYRIVSYIFERLFKPSGTSPNVLKS